MGLTYEPNQKVSVDGFLDTVQPFHDEFASSSRPFLLTQTAPKLNLSRKNRIKFLNIITHEQAVEALPYYFAAIYHNFKSEVDNRVIILPGEDGGSGTSMNKKVSVQKQTYLLPLTLISATDEEVGCQRCITEERVPTTDRSRFSHRCFSSAGITPWKTELARANALSRPAGDQLHP